MKKLMCLGGMVVGALAARADVVTNSWVGADGVSLAETRLVELDGGRVALELHDVRGTVIIFR